MKHLITRLLLVMMCVCAIPTAGNAFTLTIAGNANFMDTKTAQSPTTPWNTDFVTQTTSGNSSDFYFWATGEFKLSQAGSTTDWNTFNNSVFQITASPIGLTNPAVTSELLRQIPNLSIFMSKRINIKSRFRTSLSKATREPGLQHLSRKAKQYIISRTRISNRLMPFSARFSTAEPPYCAIIMNSIPTIIHSPFRKKV